MAGTLVRGSTRIRVAGSAAHISAAAAVAGTSGLLLAAVGMSVPLVVSIALLAVLAAAYLGAELGLWPMPIPQSGHQVPASWRYRFPQPVTAALYGGLLAPGIGTYVPFPSFVIVLGASALSGSLVAGAVIMGSYGVMRAFAAALVANFDRLSPRIDIALGLRYRWVLKLLVVGAAAAYLGGCVAMLNHLL